MSANPAKFAAGWWLATALAFTGACAMVAFYTPNEITMGVIQKVFYIHLPVAISTFGACTVVFIGSIGYLWQRRSQWDDLADAAAKIAVLFCAIVLLTGMIWARAAWGVWWTWSPRLTFSLVLWLLYVVYLMLRGSVESPQRRAMVSAVYGVIAFLDVPLVYLSARMIPDMHPASVSLTAAMKLTLAVWAVPVIMMCAGLVIARYRLNRTAREVADEAPGFAPLPVEPTARIRAIGDAL